MCMGGRAKTHLALSSSKPSSSGSDGWEKYDPEEWDRATKKADVEGYPIRVDSLKSAPSSSKAEPQVPRQAAFEIQGFFAQADEFEGASGSSIAMDRVPLREIIDPHRFSAHADILEVEASSSKAKSQRTQSDAPRLRRAETPEHSPEAPGTTPEAETPHSPEEPPISYDVDFVRALGDSDKESKVPFSEGDILRIIGHRRRADLHYHVLPLKPPGGHGRALRSCVEAASQGDVDEVGRLATTDEEKRCFKAAVEWEDD